MKKDKEIKPAIGADVGGSHISSAVVNLADGELMTTPAVTTVDCHARAGAIIDAWCRNISETLAAAATETGASIKVCIAMPGPFDYKHGISHIRGVSKFDSIFGLDVKRVLEERLDVEVSFINDAAAFALGEALSGSGRGCDDLLALTLGTGVGSGFVRNCRLVESGNDVPENGWVYNLPFEGSIADDAFSTRWIVGRYEELAGERLPGAREIADRCGSDPTAVRVFDEFGHNLARFVIPVMEKFGTSNLVLGGNITRSLSLFLPAMEEVFANNNKEIKVLPATLFDCAALVGAAATLL